MVPVLGGEVEESEQRFPVLGQTGDRLVVLGVVFVGEHIDRLSPNIPLIWGFGAYFIVVYSLTI